MMVFLWAVLGIVVLSLVAYFSLVFWALRKANKVAKGFQDEFNRRLDDQKRRMGM